MSETVSVAWWESKLIGRLDLAAFVAAVVVVYRAALDDDISWVGWVLVGATIVVLTGVHWPYGALVVLITASAMPVFFVQVFSWKARPEHFAAVIVSAAVAIWLA